MGWEAEAGLPFQRLAYQLILKLGPKEVFFQKSPRSPGNENCLILKVAKS